MNNDFDGNFESYKVTLADLHLNVGKIAKISSSFHKNLLLNNPTEILWLWIAAKILINLFGNIKNVLQFQPRKNNWKISNLTKALQEKIQHLAFYRFWPC